MSYRGRTSRRWNNYRPSDCYRPSDGPTRYSHAERDPNYCDRPHTPANAAPPGGCSDYPKLWPSDLDELINRTQRAYDLVCNYEAESCGGKRWVPEDIWFIREAGKDLEKQAQGLHHWRRIIGFHGTDKRDLMAKVKEDIVVTRALCLRVTNLINETEQECTYSAQSVPVNRYGNLVNPDDVFDEESELSKSPHVSMVHTDVVRHQ